ncbi:MAG: phosphatase PAP2 family protein [Nitrospirae bacterium]|nr:phosphatase PAP2 family protein [Nitrospirota bacterium]
MRRIILKQRPADAVTILFLLFLSVLTIIFYEDVPRAPFLISLYSILIISQVIIIRFKDRGRFIGLLYDLIFPIICVIVIFDSLEWLVHYVNPEDIDLILIRLDYVIFGNHPTVMLERIMNPLLTDILQLAYTSYYFLPVTLGIVLLRNNQREEFDRSLFLILFCFYLSYLGYILMPALGPRFTISHLQTTELKGLLIAEPIQRLLNRLEGIKRDAFPSAHTAIALIVLYLAYRFKRRLLWVFLPVVVALILSTVYCRYHYVVDIIAGFGLTFLTIFLGERYYGWWLKRGQYRFLTRGLSLPSKGEGK